MAPIFIPNESNWYLRISTDHYHPQEETTDLLMSERRYRFLLLLEGTVVFTIDQQKYTLNAGDAIFINRGVPHWDRYLKGALHHSIQLLPAPSSTRKDLDRFDFLSSQNRRFAIFPAGTPEGQAVNECISSICKEAKEQQTAHLSFIQAESIRLKAMLQRFQIISEPTAQIEEPNFRRLMPAFDYIDSHLDEPISLADLSRQLHVSEGHFCRLFKQTTALSPFEYINRARIHKARQLLVDRSLSITDIAFAVGFSSLPYFNRTFRKYAQVSPTKYRQLARND